jgi:hypothetical protein
MICEYGFEGSPREIEVRRSTAPCDRKPVEFLVIAAPLVTGCDLTASLQYELAERIAPPGQAPIADSAFRRLMLVSVGVCRSVVLLGLLACPSPEQCSVEDKKYVA